MTDTPLLRLARLTLMLSGDVLSETDADARNLHAALFDLVRDLEAAPPSEPARRTITLGEFGAFKAELNRYVKFYEERGVAGDGELARSILEDILGITVEDA